jgi:hypothetical protein
MSRPNDPEWKSFLGSPSESEIVRHGHQMPPHIGVGAYLCNSCEKPHVLVAAIYANIEIDIEFSPADARIVAMELLAAANRVDPQGVN